MLSGLECDVKNGVNRAMTSECWYIRMLSIAGSAQESSKYNVFSCLIHVIMKMQMKLQEFISSRSYYSHSK